MRSEEQTSAPKDYTRVVSGIAIIGCLTTGCASMGLFVVAAMADELLQSAMYLFPAGLSFGLLAIATLRK